MKSANYKSGNVKIKMYGIISLRVVLYETWSLTEWSVV